MTTVLISGANRGLGLEFCRQYAHDGWQVLAACRHPEQAQDLQKLAEHYPNIQIERLDVADFSQINALADKLSDQPIDLLINNAGVYGDNPSNGFGQMDYAIWTQNLLINTQAPIKMTEVFLPHLLKGHLKLIANISSLMGSISDNSSGGSIMYRSSKSALNSAMKSLSIELGKLGIGVLTLHPGWVKTDMGGPNALIEKEESVGGMRAVLANFTTAQSGGFIKYDGKSLPW